MSSTASLILLSIFDYCMHSISVSRSPLLRESMKPLKSNFGSSFFTLSTLHGIPWITFSSESNSYKLYASSNCWFRFKFNGGTLIFSFFSDDGSCHAYFVSSFGDCKSGPLANFLGYSVIFGENTLVIIFTGCLYIVSIWFLLAAGVIILVLVFFTGV